MSIEGCPAVGNSINVINDPDPDFEYIKGQTSRQDLGLHLHRLKHVTPGGQFVAAYTAIGVSKPIAQKAMYATKEHPEVIEMATAKAEQKEEAKRSAVARVPYVRSASVTAGRATSNSAAKGTPKKASRKTHKEPTAKKKKKRYKKVRVPIKTEGLQDPYSTVTRVPNEGGFDLSKRFAYEVYSGLYNWQERRVEITEEVERQERAAEEARARRVVKFDQLPPFPPVPPQEPLYPPEWTDDEIREHNIRKIREEHRAVDKAEDRRVLIDLELKLRLLGRRV